MDDSSEIAYRQRLIDQGIDPSAATEVASRTVRAKQPYGNVRPGNFNSLGVVVEQLADPIPEVMEPIEVETPQSKRRRPVEGVRDRAAKLAKEADAAGRKLSVGTSKRTSKLKTSAEQLADKVDQIKQTALVQKTKAEIKELQLTLFDIAPWADDMRALPNDLACCALFTTRNKKVPREALQKHPIYNYKKDVVIFYTGIELRADDDELVFQQVLEYVKRFPIGTPATFSFYELCTDLDWPINGGYYKKAEECLTRLQATAMQFESTRIGRLDSLSLIHRFRIMDRGTKKARCHVEIDDEMVYLFAGDYYTKFIWQKYRKLTPTARRLFDYFASHKKPFPLKLATFQLMCSSQTKRAAKWKEQSEGACNELKAAGLVEEAWVHGDGIFCER